MQSDCELHHAADVFAAGALAAKYTPHCAAVEVAMPAADLICVGMRNRSYAQPAHVVSIITEKTNGSFPPALADERMMNSADAASMAARLHIIAAARVGK